MRRGNGGSWFGAYDFFAYMIPGGLLLATGAVFPLHLRLDLYNSAFPFPQGVFSGFLASAAIAVGAYVAGLVVHQWGRSLESVLQQEKPSREIMESDPLLQGGISEAVKSQMQDHLPERKFKDGELWELAYRRISIEGDDHRVNWFQFLHTVSRGLLVLALLWIFLGVGLSVWVTLVSGLVWIGVGLLTGSVMYILRSRFDEAVAREVVLTYYLTEVEKGP